MKKLLCSLLCAIMLVSVTCGSTLAAYAKTYTYIDEVYYDADEERPTYETENYDAFGVTLNAYNGKDAEVVIPDTFDGKPVVRIGSGCFYQNTAVTSVTLPASVKEIGREAFYGCTSLKTIHLSDVEIIGEKAFAGDKRLESVDLQQLKTVERLAFSGCTALNRIALGNEVTHIEERAFYKTAAYRSAAEKNGKAFYIGNYLVNVFTDRTKGKYKVKNGTVMLADAAFVKASQKKKAKITKVVLPNSVKRIGRKALAVPSLKNIRFPDDLQFLGQDALHESYIKKKGLTKDGCTYVGPYLISSDRYVLRLKIRKGTALIAENALENSLTKKLVFPQGVKYINDSAVTGCQRLEAVTIPASTKAIGENNFVNGTGYLETSCKKLKQIRVSKSNAYYQSRDGVLFTKNMRELLVYPNNRPGKSYTLPAGVKTIKSRAFSFANHLTALQLNEGLERVEAYAFANGKIRSVTVPESVTYLGRCAFGYYFYWDEDVWGYFLAEDFTVYGKKGSAAEQYCSDRVIALMLDDTWNYLSNPIPFQEV